MKPEVAYRPSGAVPIWGHQIKMGNPGLASHSLLAAGCHGERTDDHR